MTQVICKEESYFVHIGFTYAHEERKYKVKVGHKFKKLKMTSSNKRKLDKLRKYWRFACL